MKKISSRLEELEKEAIDILKNQKSIEMLGLFVDEQKSFEWTSKVKNIIFILCGEDSIYFKDFVNISSLKYMGGENVEKFNKLVGTFKGLKDDFEKGFLHSIKKMIEADVFDSELDQAKELLKNKYKVASAVIAGIVLETALRSICEKEKIENGKLDKMNSDLAKKGIYNKLQQKRITAIADIRNNAAHGKPTEFTENDVLLMIRDVEKFLSDYLN